jgi:hypothetical protein
VVGVLSFVIGVRYTTSKLLPVILARMTEEELSRLADRAAEERRDVA